ncbi:MAG: hypothetical protein HYY17_09945 [Planctomycetes bacterium]|nr:hypothetical protein [Planctomycetota bacterium]
MSRRIWFLAVPAAAAILTALLASSPRKAAPPASPKTRRAAVSPLHETDSAVRTPAPLRAESKSSEPVTAPVETREPAAPPDSFAEELAEMLEIDAEAAEKVAAILARREEEAERVLEPYGADLTAQAILLCAPQLRLLDEAADREIVGVLDAAAGRRYMALRADGTIEGTAFSPAPLDRSDVDPTEPAPLDSPR